MEVENAGVMFQGVILGAIVFWILCSSYLNFTQKLRIFLQPWVNHHVEIGTDFVLQIQSYQHGFLDVFFSGLSCVVSVPFYTAFLPLLFWSGHGELARQMTLLMAFCDYIGNCVKDVLSAPRPPSPPVRRVTATKDEEDNALEYGLPSSHTLNTVCLSGYLLHYVLTHTQIQGPYVSYLGVSLACLFVALIGLGRIYLGMHSLIDILAGLVFGLGILAFWLAVDKQIDSFVISGLNVTSFWAALSFLLLFAYPTPELPTPSFEYHTAFNGVALGIVAGVQQTYHQFHHDAVPRLFSHDLTIPVFMGRMILGIPTILLVKFCSKALAKWIIPVVANTLGIPIKSSSYIKSEKIKQGGCLQKLLPKHEVFDVDTGIRFVQYAGLAWSVVDLVPSLFTYTNL
ncbi:PREDICTED: lipid phosphate phosphatase delta-like [Lupinus angustifolius]|uniref:lipid phosphate phosphatase delta-like n=1 Tax=Lupinus angustifolius TaxID=3871 RepID=UPI00092F45E1|nr:PREDICTED: lipid phosphate phosphatase delta-like [Lupinus angustifolius]XP_019455475.1 PREDICTED: lipid phosphate phosphatase delta-like [Lupinus angustifolius]